MAVLDPTTQAAWLAAATDDAKALTIVGALTEPVEVEIRNAADTLMGSGTMTGPWAIAVGGTVVLGEVDTDLIEALEEGAPDGSWRCLFKGANGRYVQAGFGLPGSGREVIWSLSTWVAGDKASIGTATVGAIIATNGTFSIVAADLDATTAAAFTAATSTAGQAAAIMAAMTGTVVFEIFDGSNVLRASGTMQAPWASAAGGVLTVNEVTSAGIVVASGGIPDSSWYAQYRAGTRYVRGSFGIGNSSADFVWSLSVFQTGTKATLGAVLMSCAGPISSGNNPPVWSTVPTLTVTQGGSSAALLNNYATDPDAGQTLTFTIQSGSLVPGLTFNSATGAFSASAGLAVGTYGPFVVLADDQQAASTSPANTVLPVISGTAQVGSVLTCSTGTWTGTTPITYGFQWSRNGVSIAGATASSYTQVLADLAALIACTVTSTNVTGVPVQAASASVGPVAAAPTGGALSVPFTLTSAVGGANLPWTFGHVFKQGDVQSGQSVAASAGEFQAIPTTYWPDGSVRHAIISGRTTLTANVATPITLTVGAGTGGSTLTTADLSSWLPATTITVSGHTMTLNSIVASPFRTVCAGPVMSNWIYRQAVSGSSHLVIWADVRLYKGGAVEIFPWVENAYLSVASPASTVGTSCAVTVGGVSKFSQSINISHHSRVPLLTQSVPTNAFSYWSGTDPLIAPKHDSAYLRASKMVPNYGFTSPSASTLNALQQTYTPNTLAGVSAAMGAAGGSGALIGWYGKPAQSLYVTSTDVRAYRAAIVFGLSSASWPIHYRDQTTNESIRFDQYASTYLDILPSGTGTENGTPVTTHQPSFGFLPWLITGRWFFLDEALFWASWNYLKQRPNGRRGETEYETAPFLNATGAAGVIDPRSGTYTARGAAWSLRTLAQSLAILPTTDSRYDSYKAAWEANAGFFRALFVDGTLAGGAWVHPLGVMGEYGPGGSQYGDAGVTGSTVWWNAGWMQGMLAQALGHANELSLPQSAQSQANIAAVVAHAGKFSAGLAGDGGSGNWNWRRFTVYSYPLAVNGAASLPQTWITTFGAALAAYEGGTSGLGSIPATAGATMKRHNSNTDFATSGGSANNSEYGYGAMQYAALAYAVDNGVPGASTGRARLVGSASYGPWTLDMNEDPSYGIVPRT